MAMLAAPRRKQKVINLRAKNNAWSNDSGKFGQRMLEKMGWSEGKGLGAHENGIVEHVVARYKNDDKGLGFEDRNDQWTKHEDDFNSLLANLSNGDNDDDKLHSGVSLEVKSKTSKARVHYHKFTRGKDLTRYSEKDLANIFGKKSLKDEGKDIKKNEAATEDITTTEQVFTEKGSMEDYFKNKLAALKNKNQFNVSKNYDDEYADHGFKGFSGGCEHSENHQGFGFQSFSFDTEQSDINKDNTGTEENLESTHTESTKKKKKKKNKQQSSEDVLEQKNVVDNEIPETELEVTKKVKKSKKKRKDVETEIENPKEISVEEQDTNYVPKKKKKRKNKEMGEE